MLHINIQSSKLEQGDGKARDELRRISGTSPSHVPLAPGKLSWQQWVHLEQLVQVVAELLKIEPAQVWQRNKRTIAVQAKSLVCYWATQELGMAATAVAKRLAITQLTASRGVQRGEQIATEKGWILKQLLNA